MTQAVALAQQASTGVSQGFKNRIINGAMVIDQRNAGASVTNTTSNLYPVDRFLIYGSGSSKFTAQQSSTAPAGFANSLLITSSAATTPASGDLYILRQAIEGYNIADLNWGSANAKTVTLSFQVYSSLTGTFGGSLTNGDVNRSYPFSYTVSSANTWTTISVTITGDTSGTWNTTNGTGIRVYFNLGAGSSFNGTAGAWATVSDVTFPAGAVQVVATSGATFYITGVQLEVGSTATSFDYRPFGTELQLCQRYYETAGYGLLGITNSATGLVFGHQFKTTKRTAPTVGLYTTTQTWAEIGTADRSSSSVSIGDAARTTVEGTATRIEGFSGMNTTNPIICWGSTAIAITFSAEL